MHARVLAFILCVSHTILVATPPRAKHQPPRPMITVSQLDWTDINVTIPSKGVCLINSCSGSVHAGEVLALMGPSGSGKTTLLNVLAQRGVPPHATKTGTVSTESFIVNPSNVRQFSSYVEQEDSLIGSLTVEETVDFACQFNDASLNARRAKGEQIEVPEKSRSERVYDVLSYLGLHEQRGVRVGTTIQKGISGGQKRRLSVAAQIVGSPSVLFLDEPTSGLDSTAAYHVVKAVKDAAKAMNMAVIMSIHQPSTATFQLFDKVLFLSKGNTIYNGPLEKLLDHFETVGHPIPPRYNPAEYVLELTNTDFSAEARNSDCDEHTLVEYLASEWEKKTHNVEVSYVESTVSFSRCRTLINCAVLQSRQTFILARRLFIKARRDILAYYVRIVMYLGLAILMGTVWLRLGDEQRDIQPFINAIFFSGAFLSFMTVAYIPAYLEDLQSYKKEFMNGQYGPGAFVVANFLVGLPFIFVIVCLFSVVTYFMCNFRHSASGFWYYVMWLFLDLLAAESLTIFVATLAPIFVVALALTAFANGLWMSVGGFLVSSNILNVFWYYTFYWINYQRYTFQGMMFNEFSADRIFKCGSGCNCMYVSDLASKCQIRGTAVLEALGYNHSQRGLWAGVLIALIFGYRFLTYLTLRFKH